MSTGAGAGAGAGAGIRKGSCLLIIVLIRVSYKTIFHYVLFCHAKSL